jgi:hypothetical protein
MIITKIVLPMAIALPLLENNVSCQQKHTITYNHCQEPLLENTIDYNYITTEKWLNDNLDKYQDILP